MRKLLNFLPTHFTVCLIIGIVIQFHYKLWVFTNEQTVFLFVIFLLAILLSKHLKKKLLFTVLSWVLFVILGMFIVFSKDKTSKNDYYLNYTEKEQLITFRVEKKLKGELVLL
jgi:competence protein ComEC